MPQYPHLSTIAVLAGALTCSSSAGTLMLDLGATLYNGNNSPAHFEGAVSNDYTTWVQLSNPDNSALNETVQDSDGNSIGLYFGRNSDETGNDIDWNRSGSDASDTGGSGIFGTDLTSDAVQNIAGFNRDPIGIMFTGLAKGDYEIYVVAHYAGNLNTTYNVLGAVDETLNNGGSATDIADIYDFADAMITLDASNSSSWELGNNYTKFSFSITETDDTLYIFSDSSQSTVGTSYLSSVQIVPIPEPGTAALWIVAGAGVALIRRNRANVRPRS